MQHLFAAFLSGLLTSVEKAQKLCYVMLCKLGLLSNALIRVQVLAL